MLSIDHFIPSDYHLNYLSGLKPKLAYKKGQDPILWQRKLLIRLKKLLGDFPKEKISLKPKILKREEFSDYFLEEIAFRSESFADVAGYFLIPKKITLPAPAVICLQGHAPGMHISLGKIMDKGDKDLIRGDRDFAMQAIKEGYIALAIEQRCFGKRAETRQKARAPHGCQDATMHSLMLGKTLIGERVWDVMRSIDYLKTRPEVDPKRIACMGNSGGGTVTFFASCLDKRIKVAIPSCYYCNYADGIMKIYHCVDNYIPGIMKFADMGDLAGLIAPRPLIIVAGEKDKIFPIEGVKKAFKQTKKIYKAFKGEHCLHLLIGKGGHRFYKNLTWPIIKRYL